MIANLGYDPEAERLVVQFNSGKFYQYDGVPSDSFVAVITSKESVGKAFNFHIKNKAFPFKELKDEDIPTL